MTEFDLKPSAIVNEGHASATPWYHLRQVLDVVRASICGEWAWPRNVNCKYIDVRIDMRSGECLIRDRHGKVITMEELTRQL